MNIQVAPLYAALVNASPEQRQDIVKQKVWNEITFEIGYKDLMLTFSGSVRLMAVKDKNEPPAAPKEDW